jgi:hypothetical protein
MGTTLVAVKEPRMSLKMLCEYREASAITRNSIIKDSKFSKPFVTARYNEAESLISEYLANARDYPEILLQASAELKKSSLGLKDMQKEHALSSAYAIEKFSKMAGKLKSLSNLIIRAEENKSRKIVTNGVKVSIRPELLISDCYGLEYVGFIKLYFGKSKPLTKTLAESMACFGKHYFKQKEDRDFSSKNCYVIDVCAVTLYTAPKSYKRIIQELEYCCSEIADRWDKIN